MRQEALANQRARRDSNRACKKKKCNKLINAAQNTLGSVTFYSRKQNNPEWNEF